MKKDTQLAKVEKVDLDTGKREKLGLETWTRKFNEAPDPKVVKKNRFANDQPYLPISYIENELDRLFFGMWSTDDFQWKLVGNEMGGQITLKLKHPFTGEIFTRIGTAGVQVRINKNTNEKIANALSMDLPHLEAQCVKSAAKKLGNRFGRNIGRKQEDVDKFETLLQKKSVTEEKDKKLFEADEEVIEEEVIEGEYSN